MRSRIVVCSLILFPIVFAAGCSMDGAPAQQPASGTDARSASDPVARGMVVYQQNCQTCHGARGRGDGPTAYQCSTKPADLAEPDVAGRSPNTLFRKVSEGGSGTPAFGKLLGEQE